LSSSQAFTVYDGVAWAMQWQCRSHDAHAPAPGSCRKLKKWKWNSTGVCLTKWKEFRDVLHVLRKYYFQLFTSQRYILTAIFLFPGPYLISKWTFFGEKWAWTFSSKKTRLTKWKFLPICNFFKLILLTFFSHRGELELNKE